MGTVLGMSRSVCPALDIDTEGVETKMAAVNVSNALRAVRRTLDGVLLPHSTVESMPFGNVPAPEAARR
eukprot:908336-Rhodomonas_salina.1